jgi:hypothetical protein
MLQACPRCGFRMSVIANITDPVEMRTIIADLDGYGRGPPSLGRSLPPPRPVRCGHPPIQRSWGLQPIRRTGYSQVGRSEEI